MPDDPSKSPIQHSALSKGQVTVLKRIVQEGNFRTEFFRNPKDAIAKAGVALPQNELAVISKITPRQVDAMQTLFTGPGRVAADGTHTLAYAIAFAVVVAVLLAMPNPMDVSAFAKQQ